MHVFVALPAVGLSPRSSIFLCVALFSTLSRSSTVAADASSSRGLIDIHPLVMSLCVYVDHVPVALVPNAFAPYLPVREAAASDVSA